VDAISFEVFKPQLNAGRVTGNLKSPVNAALAASRFIPAKPMARPEAQHFLGQAMRFSSIEGHRDLVYSETPSRVIPGRISGNLEVYNLVDPKTKVKQEAYFLQQPGTGLVSAGTVIDGGSIFETPENNGLFHFTEHMLFKATGDGKGGTRFQSGSFDRFMENRHLEINAMTSWDKVGYYFYHGLAKHAQEGLHAHADFLQNPKFDPKDLNDERGSVVSEIKMYRDQMSTRLFYATMADLYLPHPYGMTILGPEKNIQTLPDKTFVDFYLKHYGPEHRKILVIGDFDKKETLKTLSQTFNQNPERFIDHIPEERPKPAQRDAVVRKVFYEKAMQPADAMTIWAYRGPNATDVKDDITFDLISTLLGGSDASNVYQDLKEKKQLVRKLDSGSMSLKEGALFQIIANSATDKTDAFEKRLGSLIEGLKAGKTKQAELDLMKTELKTLYLKTNAKQVSLWGNLSGLLAHGTVDQLYGDRYLEALAAITLQDIQRVANTYLKPGNKIEYRILSKELEPKGIGAPPSGNLPPAVPAISRSQSPRFGGSLPEGAHQYKTAQGTTVVFKKPLPGEQRIALTITLPFGTAVEQTPGELQLMTALMEKQTVLKDAGKMARYLAQNGIVVRSEIEEDSVQFTFTGDACNLSDGQLKINDPYGFDKIVSIATEMLTRPSFMKREVDAEKENIAAQHRETMADEPEEQALMEHVSQFYPAGSRYATTQQDVVEHLPKIDGATLRKRQRQLMQPDKITVSVVANLDQDHMTQKLNEMSAAIGKVNGKYRKSAQSLTLRPALNPVLTENVMKVKIRKEEDIEQTQFNRSWAVPPLKDKETRLALSLLYYVMSGGMSRRLFQTFREGENGGLCYSTYGYYKSGTEAGGRFNLYIGTPHNNVPLVLSLFDKEMDQLLKGKPVSPEELEWAKEAFRKSELESNFLVERQSNGVGAHIALDYASKLDLFRMLDEMTPERMQAIVKGLFENKPALTTLLTTTATAQELRMPVDTPIKYDDWSAQNSAELIRLMAEKIAAEKARLAEEAKAAQ
jgi:predicted Zn-dependent peptidase